MEEKTQGGVGEFPNMPSNLQETLQAPKSVSLSCKMRNGPNPRKKQDLKPIFLACQRRHHSTLSQ